MSDKELLELAAKAAGIEGHFGLKGETNNFWRDDGSGQWSPLINDGDALRLAVKLNMDMFQDRDFNHVSVNGCYEDFIEDDPYAATRRAIVRAAAEIGKEMK